jgi:hypothetical protein
LAFHFSKTKRPGSLTGSVRSITALITLKMAVFPPNGECKRNHDSGRKSRALAQLPQRVAKILN